MSLIHLTVSLRVTTKRKRMNEKRMTMMGVAAMLPGMQLALDVLQAQISEYRTLLQALQMADGTMPKRRGRPPGTQKKLLSAPAVEEAPAKKSVMTPAGRKALSVAMKKRWAEAKKRGVNITGDKTRRGTAPKQRHGWSGMTREERKAEMARRQAVRRGEVPGKKAKAAA